MHKNKKRSNRADNYNTSLQCFCAGKIANNLRGHKRVRLPCGGAMVTLRTFLNHEKAHKNDGADQIFVDSDTEDLEAHSNAGYIFICVLSIYIYIYLIYV